MPDTFMAEVESHTTDETDGNYHNGLWSVDMEIDWDKEQDDLEKLYAQMLSGRNPERIKRGIEAYKRDLPQLVRDQKEHYVVAYDGDTRVGMEKTREKLLSELKRQGVSKNKNLFIKIVSSLEDSKETLSSCHER
jgi:hypothetical protein